MSNIKPLTRQDCVEMVYVEGNQKLQGPAEYNATYKTKTLFSFWLAGSPKANTTVLSGLSFCVTHFDVFFLAT